MKYKIYSNGKSFKIPNQQLNGYGEVVLSPDDTEVALSLVDGDILYITRGESDLGDRLFTWSLESGCSTSLFYTNLDYTHSLNIYYPIYQGGFNYLTFDDLSEPAIIRIYKFGSTENGFGDIYEIEGVEGTCASKEQWCKKHGKLVGVIYFYSDDAENYFFRTIDPTGSKEFAGQTIKLPTIGDKIFISNVAQTQDGNGFYFTFDSGEEGIGFFMPDGDADNGYFESYEGWFGGDNFYSGGSKVWIYHCGAGLYQFLEEQGLDSESITWYNFNEATRQCESYFGSPTILAYIDGKWEIEQEGERRDL